LSVFRRGPVWDYAESAGQVNSSGARRLLRATPSYQPFDALEGESASDVTWPAFLSESSATL
jgi:hypothetical protein